MRPATEHTPRRGFTLIELIVAIGAVALIAVGIAAVFNSVGDTVAGGRRASVLNQFASLIERQMRDDFENMTRDGVLVIRHQYADERNPVQLHAEDANPRVRRVDELVFFRSGRFTSARTPIAPGFQATSTEAKIYYGHGIRLDPFADVVGRSINGRAVRFDRPQVSDGNEYQKPHRRESGSRVALALGYRDNTYETNPNLYASDWALLRLQTLLAPPGSSLQKIPDAAVLADLGLDPLAVLDSDIQVGGQPAAISAFRTLASQEAFADPEYPENFIRDLADQRRMPSECSGIVDVASTSLAEIRRIVMDVGAFPWDLSGWGDIFDPSAPESSLLNDQYTSGMSGDLGYMQAWMQDLFPSEILTGMRVRYEPNLPDYVGTLSIYSDDRTSRWPAIQNFRLADQRMLGAGVFVPRCTEFIVEYSFGETVTDTGSVLYGQLVWHGMDRDVATAGGGTFQAVSEYPFYEDPQTGQHPKPHNTTYAKFDGTTGTHALTREVLYSASGLPNDPDVVTAHFGYTDPTYQPGTSDDPPTIPWAWPKLIRVTMTLADPTDPSIEETFQFVFETPAGEAF